MYTPDPKLTDRIENDFTYHMPLPSQPDRYVDIRDAARLFAHMLTEKCPPSRELSLALTNLEVVVFYANASIARNEKP
jgi:hypothetical protein